MRPVEAMREAVARSRELGADGVYTDHEQVMAELRTLGFAIVPIEPTDEQVEAMARALAEGQGFYDSYDFDNHLVPAEAAESFRNFARAAYAAAVKDVGGD